MKVAAVTRPRRRHPRRVDRRDCCDFPRRSAAARQQENLPLAVARRFERAPLSVRRPARMSVALRRSGRLARLTAALGSDQPNIRLRPVFLLEHLRHHRARTNHTFLNKFIFTERTEFRTELTEPNTLSAL